MMHLSQLSRYKKGQELPLNRWVNPFTLLYAVPNHKPVEVIDLLRRCGIEVLINEPPQPPPKPHNPYRDLAAYVLLQAIHDTFYGTNRKDRAEARSWLLHDNEWFPWWCDILDLKAVDVRSSISRQLHSALPSISKRLEYNYVVH